jgi:hypothetical protein
MTYFKLDGRVSGCRSIRSVQPIGYGGRAMNEERFNMEFRKFLKQVGITTQREVERAVRDAIAKGQLSGNETINARARVQIDALDLDHVVEGTISLE